MIRGHGADSDRARGRRGRSPKCDNLSHGKGLGKLGPAAALNFKLNLMNFKFSLQPRPELSARPAARATRLCQPGSAVTGPSEKLAP